jgi:trehalose 6-phosphate phosphatase
MGDFSTDPRAEAAALPRSSSKWALFLDVDGTLLDIAETPYAVVVPAGLVELLGALERGLGGAIALVSGRSLAALDQLFHPLRLPAAGQHGLERRGVDGSVRREGIAVDALDRVRQRLAGVEAELPGLLIEDKGATVAVHYRRSPAPEGQVMLRVDDAVRDLDSQLELLAGKKVFEIRPRGAGKDKVIESFMAEPPFRGRTPVFAGDDRTDEQGFAAVNRLGGHSIHVGEQASGARHRLASPAAVREWLAAVARELGADEARRDRRGGGGVERR